MEERRTETSRAERARSESESHATVEPRAKGAARKPSSIEPRDWRGDGVCGDRHTD